MSQDVNQAQEGKAITGITKNFDCGRVSGVETSRFIIELLRRRSGLWWGGSGAQSSVWSGNCQWAAECMQFVIPCARREFRIFF